MYILIIFVFTLTQPLHIYTLSHTYPCIYITIHLSYNFYSCIKTVGVSVLGGFWALEWAWHIAETNLRCAGISGMQIMPKTSIVAPIVSEISAFIRTE